MGSMGRVIKIMKDNIIIVGAGVTGLSIGWQLRRMGIPVTLIDSASAGSGASLKAAGMITPAAEIRFGEPHLTKFFIESLNSYHQFVKELQNASGIDIDFQQKGALTVAIDGDDEAELERFHDYQKELGLDVQLISGAEVAELEPLIAPTRAGLIAHHECFLDNRLLIQALLKAFTLSGGNIIENKRIDSLEIEDKKLKKITIGPEKWEVTQVILATGHELPLGIPPELVLPLRPVKGQILELKTSPSLLPSRAIRSFHRHPAYLVPRSDGRLIVGATTEDVGLDDRPTAGGAFDLLKGAWRVLPAIEEMEVLAHHVGFRAAARDHSPLLGRTSVEGLSIALGMYRHGIMLAPLVGKIMAELIAEGKESEYLEMFSCKRFNPSHPAV